MELFDSDTDDTNGDEPPRQRRRIVTVNDSDDDDDEDDDDDDGVDSSGDGDTVMTISAQDLLNSMFSSSGTVPVLAGFLNNVLLVDTPFWSVVFVVLSVDVLWMDSHDYKLLTTIKHLVPAFITF